MTKADLADRYRGYIACLNAQDWPALGQFVGDTAIHNGKPLGVAGYRAMLEKDFDEIPNLFFNVSMLICDPPFVASRIDFDCRPRATFLGLAVNGRRVAFSENVIYQFHDGKIIEVWSLVDRAAIETQLS